MEIYVQVILKRMKYVILVMLISVGIAAGITYITPDYYRSSTTLLVQPFGLGSVNNATYSYSQQLATTFTNILESRSVEEEVAQSIGIEDVSDLPDYSSGLIPESELFRISVTDSDPNLAQEVADILAAILIERISLQYSVNLNNIETDLTNRVLELEDEITGLVQEQAALAEQVPRNNVRIAEIDRLLASKESVYRTLQNSLNDMISDQSAQSNLISVFEPAILPDKPAGPSFVINLFAGIVTGVVGGLSFAFLLEALQPKLYSNSQIEAVMRTQILSTIPKIGKRDLNNVLEFGTNKLLIEFFRRLRNTIESLMRDQCDGNSISFLDYEHNEENGVLLTYFGIVLARSSKRTVIIDVNSYHPTIHTKLGLEENLGLTDVLDGKSEIKDVIQSTAIEHLDFVSVGTRTDFAVELYSSPKMSELLTELENMYDYVLFNAPPILTVTDGMVIARQLCTNVIVMKPDADKTVAEKASQELRKLDIKVLGVILSGVDLNNSQRQARKYIKSHVN
ncbi:MAG: Wzz/FepE/Etk N-terminal domain-containing protein [Anaerolineae bacterium]